MHKTYGIFWLLDVTYSGTSGVLTQGTSVKGLFSSRHSRRGPQELDHDSVPCTARSLAVEVRSHVLRPVSFRLHARFTLPNVHLFHSLCGERPRCNVTEWPMKRAFGSVAQGCQRLSTINSNVIQHSPHSKYRCHLRVGSRSSSGAPHRGQSTSLLPARFFSPQGLQ
jgi:hypothetical protein